MVFISRLCLFLLVWGMGSLGIVAKEAVKVLVSIPPQVEWVKAVAGEYADVLSLVPENTALEGYKLTPLQLSFAKQAQLYVSFGHLSFETEYMSKIVSANAHLKVLKTSQSLLPSNLKSNPYIWMSPVNVIPQIEQIRDTFIEMDPKRTKYYTKHAYRYIYHLRFLDKKIKNHMAKHKGKTILSVQPIFTDYVAHYDIKQFVLGKLPTKANMLSIVKRARRANVGVVIIQSDEDRDMLGNLATKLHAEIIDINPLSKSYLQMMEGFGLNLSISFIRNGVFKNRR